MLYKVNTMDRIPADFGFAIPLGEGEDVSTTILEIPKGKRITKHYHKKMEEIEIILEGKAMVNGVEKKKGDISAWKTGEKHEYINNGPDTVRLLCVCIPKYDPSDSYEVK